MQHQEEKRRTGMASTHARFFFHHYKRQELFGRRSTEAEAPSKHAQRKGNKLARTGRESSPGPFAGNPRRRTTRRNPRPTVPGAAKKAKNIELVRACAIETHFDIKQKQESAVNATRNARGQKSTPHFLRACAVETHFNIKQEHESAAHTRTYHAKRSRTEVDTSLCASLRSRNAFQHQARARICGTYQDIPRKTLADRAGTSIWHQGLFSYRKNPLV